MVKSPFPDIAIPTDVDVQGMCLNTFETHKGKVAVIDAVTGHEYRYEDLLHHIRAVASGLAKLGLRKGDVLAIFSSNSPEWIFLFFAAICNGAIVTTINPSYTAYEVKHHVLDSKAKFIYSTNAHADIVFEVAKECPSLKELIFLGGRTGCVDFHHLLNDDGSHFPSVHINPVDDVAVLPYSSGTTGLPKGVMITHYNIVSQIMQFTHEAYVDQEMVATDEQSVVLGFLPFFHCYGMLGVMTATLLQGNRLVTLPRFEPTLFLETIQKYKVNSLLLVPPIVLFLAKHPMVSEYDLSSVKKAGCGAAPLPEEVMQQFVKRLKVPQSKQAYGMTETTLVSTMPPQTSPVRPGSSGPPVPNVEIQVVDPETGAVLGTHQRGELWIRGPNVMKGYLNQPEATHSTKDDEGWLHTGDIGYYDDDSYFYIVDRMKELIKFKGFQVAPAELEALLQEHPKIADAAVIGVPDAEAGELPKAYVVLKPKCEMSVDDVKNFVAGKMARFKQLRGGVDFVASVPKSPSGKILRKELRAQLTKSKL
ncbi:hypothetical protein CAPTEDRAFT_20304 [Capitella teleta]|uniref:Luciferin 4-monooxygenase n=1 Tax=Capitella teleta TaxID=283909 RepID=R7TV03_CAPTE|nr:hypothetical protein CAPTEDRAFT_20304 [Capitella teleta]|eukprot:ELT94820.1 hypothetical protein CAPTEDRAFT_20304 [Capitella teleta]